MPLYMLHLLITVHSECKDERTQLDNIVFSKNETKFWYLRRVDEKMSKDLTIL